MKRQTATSSKPSKSTRRAAALKTLAPKKDAKGADGTSRAGVGVLRSLDGGKTWVN